MTYGYQNQNQASRQQNPSSMPSYGMPSGGGIESNIETYRARLKALGLEDSVVDKMLGGSQDFLKEYSPKSLIGKGVSSMFGGGAASGAAGAGATGAAASGSAIGRILSAL